MATININPTSWAPTKVESSQEVTVTTDTGGWSAFIAAGSSWVSLSKKSDTASSKTIVSVSANETGNTRTGTIRFYHSSSNTIYTDLTVSQESYNTVLSKDGIIIEIPKFGWAFNPIIVNCTNPLNNIIIASITGDIKISKTGYNKKTIFDLSGLSQLAFDRDEFYKIEEKDTTLFKTMMVSFSYKPIDSTDTVYIGLASINVIWGGLQIGGIGEKIYKELVYFPSYPYTIPVMREADSKLRMRIDSGNYSDEMNILAGTKYNIPINHPEANKRVVVRIDNADDTLNDKSIFTDKFDHTFRDTYDSTHIIVLNVGCEPPGGVYLRWLNARAEWCYYLFKQTSETISPESSDIVFEQFYDTVNYVNGHHAGTGQYVGKSGTKTKSLTAVFLDEDIYDYVAGITTSPIIDLYDNGNWMRVKINDTDIVKSNKVLQDISIEIVLPDMITQRL